MTASFTTDSLPAPIEMLLSPLAALSTPRETAYLLALAFVPIAVAPTFVAVECAPITVTPKKFPPFALQPPTV